MKLNSKGEVIDVKRKLVKFKGLGNENNDDSLFSKEAVKFIIKKRKKYILTYGESEEEYIFSLNGAEIFLKKIYFDDDIEIKKESKALKLLGSILKIMGKDNNIEDAWDKFDYEASVIDAGMTEEELYNEKWKNKKECFLNFAHQKGINLISTDKGFRFEIKDGGKIV